jgi:hypothetical protein
MFSRKRKREASLTEISEDIAKFFADIKDPCGFKCVPNLKVDVREGKKGKDEQGIEEGYGSDGCLETCVVCSEGGHLMC